MKCILVLCALVAIAVARPDGEKYTTKYDSIDIDSILSNERLSNNYVNCLLEKGKCNEEGNTLKQVIPDALITGCTKCSEKQRESIRKVVQHLVKKRPADWDALLAKYDPNGTYRHNYQKYLDEVKN